MAVVPPATPPPWRLRARCSDDAIPLSTFFPSRSAGGIAAPAKQICAQCPVQIECLGEGLREPSGVWGGLAERQRREAWRLVKEGWQIADVHFYLTTRPSRKRGRKWPAAPVSPLRIKIEMAWEESIAS